MISKQTIDRIKEAARIEEVVGDYTELKQRGKGLWGLCPFHNEHKPSFKVDPIKNNCKCFGAGCGKGGNAINFLMEKEKITFPDALRRLAKKYNIPIEGGGEFEPEKPKLKPREFLQEGEGEDAIYFKLDTSEKPIEHTDIYGNVIGYEVRYIDRQHTGVGKPAKTCRPYIWDETAKTWRVKLPDERLPYNLHRIATNTLTPVIRFEGARKARHVSEKLAGHFIPTSNFNGGNGWVNTDWSQCYGRDFWIFPDKDTPGYRSAFALKEKMLPFCNVYIVRPPKDAPRKWDVIDGGYIDDLAAYILDPANHKRYEKDGAALFEVEASLPPSPAGEVGVANPAATDILPFPVNSFPVDVQEIINATVSTLNHNADFIGSALLAAAAAAIGNSHSVRVKQGFDQKAILYLCLVGPPGTNKTAPLSFAHKPLSEIDANNYSEWEENMREYKRQLSQWKKAQDGQDEPEKPVWKKTIVTDCTQEGLVAVHKMNKRGIAVFADELAGWFGNFNRYTNGSDEQFWLSCWSGEAIRVDRKTSDPVFIPCPFISVSGAIQDDVLKDMAKGDKSKNGFVDRILFAFPDGVKKEAWNDTTIDPAHVEKWRLILDRLSKYPATFDQRGNPVPVVRTFSTEARAMLFDWQKKNTDESNAADTNALRGVIGKFDMQAVRLALVIDRIKWACVNHAGDEQITPETVAGAIALAEYFKSCARKVQDTLTGDPLAGLPKDKSALYAALPEQFTTKQAVDEGAKLRIPAITVKRFLNERFFEREGHGRYSKKYQ